MNQVFQYTFKALCTLAVLCIFLLGFKSCSIEVWHSPSTPITYATYGEDNRFMKITFLPKNKAIFQYQDPNSEIQEFVLTKIRGRYGEHYFWRLWYLDSPWTSFGYRIYPAGFTPVSMEIEVLQKYFHGTGKPSFAELGEKTRSTLLFKEGVVKFENMLLIEEATDKLFVDSLLKRLKN